MPMPEIIDFLRRCIAEDRFQAVGCGSAASSGRPTALSWCFVHQALWGHPPTAATMRVLRQCEVYSDIIEQCAHALDAERNSPYDDAGRVVLASEILKDLASLYADRPDYQEEWAS